MSRSTRTKKITDKQETAVLKEGAKLLSGVFADMTTTIDELDRTVAKARKALIAVHKAVVAANDGVTADIANDTFKENSKYLSKVRVQLAEYRSKLEELNSQSEDSQSIVKAVIVMKDIMHGMTDTAKELAERA